MFHRPAAEYTPQQLEDMKVTQLKSDLVEAAVKIYEEKEHAVSPPRMRELERVLMMQVIDKRWMDHIDEMDQMRQGISLRSYAQRDPLVEYKMVGYDMFESMSDNIQLDTVRMLFNIQVTNENQPQMKEAVRKEDLQTNSSETAAVNKTTRRTAEKVGPNAPCTCGSGLKYKKCCGGRG